MRRPINHGARYKYITELEGGWISRVREPPEKSHLPFFLSFFLFFFFFFQTYGKVGEERNKHRRLLYAGLTEMYGYVCRSGGYIRKRVAHVDRHDGSVASRDESPRYNS